ncbi:Olfactory Receptor 5B2 [Manis pentadactyla]|nr:Olfactory Receptor 5B2 [Manis pentadactyla]
MSQQAAFASHISVASFLEEGHISSTDIIWTYDMDEMHNFLSPVLSSSLSNERCFSNYKIALRTEDSYSTVAKPVSTPHHPSSLNAAITSELKFSVSRTPHMDWNLEKSLCTNNLKQTESSNISIFNIRQHLDIAVQ